MAEIQVAAGLREIPIRKNARLEVLCMELHQNIFQRLHSRDIFHVALSCRALTRPALRVLYRNIRLPCGSTNTNSCHAVGESFLDSILSNAEEPLTHTREIKIFSRKFDHRRKNKPTDESKALETQVRMLLKLCTPKIQSFKWAAPYAPIPLRLLKDVRQRFSGCIAALTLSGKSPLDIPHGSQSFLNLPQDCLPVLRRLRFYQIKGHIGISLLRGLLGAAPSLHKLVIHLDYDWFDSASVPADVEIGLSQLRARDLKVLHLENFLLTIQQTVVLNQIVALESFVLKGCVMPDDFFEHFKPNLSHLRSVTFFLTYADQIQYEYFVSNLSPAVESFSYAVDNVPRSGSILRNRPYPFDPAIITAFKENLKAFGFLCRRSFEYQIGETENCETAIETLPEGLEELCVGINLTRRTPRSWVINKPRLRLGPFRNLKKLRLLILAPSSADINSNLGRLKILPRRVGARSLYVAGVPEFFVAKYAKLGWQGRPPLEYVFLSTRGYHQFGVRVHWQQINNDAGQTEWSPRCERLPPCGEIYKELGFKSHLRKCTDVDADEWFARC